MSQETMDSQEVFKNPEKQYSFTILRPGGNDTALVAGVIRDADIRKEVNDVLLAWYKNAEQVGFVNLDPDNAELMMAGGEFCGNATRSTAYLALRGKPGTISIRVSGVENTLNAGVTETGEAFAQMPIYSDVNKVTADGDNRIVKMEGITQYINFDVEEIAGLSEEQLKEKAMNIIREKNLDQYPAAGVIWSEKIDNEWRITPVVYVKAIDTIFAETACGSGTTALGLVLALEEEASISDVPIVQPTNVPIKVSVEFDGKTFGYAQISGPVENLTEGKLIEKNGITYTVEQIQNKDVLAEAFNAGLVDLYKDIFGKAPYFESFTDEEVKSIFTEYVRFGMLFLAKSEDAIVGFGAAVPIICAPDIMPYVPLPENRLDSVWYMADLGVREDFRDNGIARKLVQARLEQLRGRDVVMRTSVNNIASQSLYRSLGFQQVPYSCQIVDGPRTVEGISTKDKRIFFMKDDV